MQDEVTVTQVDERAVAEFHRQSFETLFATTDADIDAGINRAHTLLCQAFARHRHQAERDVDLVAEAECMKQMRETAQDMGYSDVLDALEALANLKAAQPSGDEVGAVARKLETLFVVQMDAQADDTLPSSIHREQGRVWLEGWFDLKDAARAALGEKP